MHVDKGFGSKRANVMTTDRKTWPRKRHYSRIHFFLALSLGRAGTGAECEICVRPIRSPGHLEKHVHYCSTHVRRSETRSALCKETRSLARSLPTGASLENGPSPSLQSERGLI